MGEGEERGQRRKNFRSVIEIIDSNMKQVYFVSSLRQSFLFLYLFSFLLSNFFVSVRGHSQQIVPF